MASIASACRLSARAARRHLSQGSSRGFRTAPAALAATNFSMPALSPTMTEGNIATWRVKEGDSFSAGDVLLEIETDKAQMDVEAQDDGILAKITVGDGSKGVKVGSRIAVVAEPGDDLSSLEIPAEETAKEAPKQEKAAKPQEKPATNASSQPKENKIGGSEGKAQKQTYPLYPAVQHLLAENGLSKQDADSIPATGPSGRLLKGDVLAYLGRIDKSYSAGQSKRIEKLSHLDLSNIKIKKVEQTSAVKPGADKKAAAAGEQIELAVEIPFDGSKDEKQVKKAIATANKDLPLVKRAELSPEALFNEVLGLPVRHPKQTSQGNYQPKVTISSASRPKSDIIDLLAATSLSQTPKGPKLLHKVSRQSGGQVKTFTLSVPKEEEERATAFLNSLAFTIQFQSSLRIAESEARDLSL